MSVVRIPTNFNIELEFEVPEFYRRLVALILDLIIEFLYIWLVFRPIMLASSLEGGIDNGGKAFLLLLPIMVYHVVLEILLNGQSLGKKVMGIRVVSENGGKESISQAIIRWMLRISDLWLVLLFFYLVSVISEGGSGLQIFFTLLLIGFVILEIILSVSSKKGQRLGDMLAGTILVRTHQRTDIRETVFQEVADSYVPSFPAIMQLSDKDINAIKSILETARRKGDFSMAENASNKIKAHLGIDAAMSPFDFLDTLLKDYNYLSTK